MLKVTRTIKSAAAGMILLSILISEICIAKESFAGDSRMQRSISQRIVDRFDRDSSAEVQLATSQVTSSFGARKGYTLNGSVGLAKLSSNGDFVTPTNRRSNCTTATHAAFLRTISNLHKSGKLQLSQRHIQLLNGSLFWNVWNANGHSIMQIIDDLGGTVHKNRALKQLKPGDFVKIDRTNRTGHTVVFSGFKNGKICYWSSNTASQGLGEKCEAIKGSAIVAARMPPAHILAAKLDDLAQELNTGRAYAQVRKKGSKGYVSLNGIKNLVTTDSGREMASVAFGDGIN